MCEWVTHRIISSSFITQALKRFQNQQKSHTFIWFLVSLFLFGYSVILTSEIKLMRIDWNFERPRPGLVTLINLPKTHYIWEGCCFLNFPWKCVSKQHSRHSPQKVKPLLSWLATCWPPHLTPSHWSTQEQQDHPHCRQLLVGGVAHVTVAVAGWHAAPLVWNVTSDTGVGGGRALTQPPRPATGLPALQHRSSHPPHLTKMSTKTTQGKGRSSGTRCHSHASSRWGFPSHTPPPFKSAFHCIVLWYIDE